MMSRPTVRTIVILVALAAALGACSLPTNEGVTPIDADGLPPEIANTTTTSTTTTTTTTAPPPTSVPPETTAPTTPPPPPSTNAPAATAAVDIYYADSNDGMQRLQRQLPEPVSLQSVITQLEEPLDDIASYRLHTALEPNLIGATIPDRGVLTVSLNGSVWEPMNEAQKRLAITQMVLTFTSFTIPGEGNVGSVVLQVDGTAIPVFIPDGTTVDAGTPVVFQDFAASVLGTSGGAATSAPPDTSVPPTQTTAAPAGPNQ